MFCVCGDRAQRKPHFAREKPFYESKTLCVQTLDYVKDGTQRPTLITSERGALLKAQFLLTAPRLDGNFDTRRVSKLPSFLRKNDKNRVLDGKYRQNPVF